MVSKRWEREKIKERRIDKPTMKKDLILRKLKLKSWRNCTGWAKITTNKSKWFTGIMKTKNQRISL